VLEHERLPQVKHPLLCGDRSPKLLASLSAPPSVINERTLSISGADASCKV
jgi:hypothetical protein